MKQSLKNRYDGGEPLEWIKVITRSLENPDVPQKTEVCTTARSINYINMLLHNCTILQKYTRVIRKGLCAVLNLSVLAFFLIYIVYTLCNRAVSMTTVQLCNLPPNHIP